MTIVTPSRRGSGRTPPHSTPSNTRNKSPTRSQRKEDRLPKKHFNMFDQTLLPEEDFSGGKLLRKRKTSLPTDSEPPSKRRKTASPHPKNDENSDQIQVSSKPRIPPPPVSQPVSALQKHPNNETPPQRSSSSQVVGTREFRIRDKSINYTIPPLKSLLPTPPPPRKRRSSAPPPSAILIPKKIRTEIPSTPVHPSPRPVGRPRLLRTVTQRNGQKMLLVKLHVASNKLASLVRKPRIRIVEGSTGRKRRVREDEEVEEEQPVEQKREPEKPFGGILSKEDADTSKTTPTEIDRARFDRARDAAIAHAQTQPSITVARSASEVPSSAGGHPIAETAFRIRAINFGNYRVKTHYASPYPEEYSRQSVLGICEFCLKYMTGEWVGWRHRLKCPVKHPPGDEIYRDGKISVFEVDGRKNPVYCQNLCLLAKMYLDHKTLYYDVEPFLFYVLCECDDRGCHFVGYFSKEKRSMAGYNLSCIVTLPIYQRKGYGFFLISFSYLLSQRENRLGSPEKPLSDLGLLSYRSYWKTALATALLDILDRGVSVSIQELGKRTGMTDDDVISGLEGLDALVKDPETGIYAIKVNPEKLIERVELVAKKGYVKVKEELLKWTPYLLGRKEAREMLEGGLEELIHQRMVSSGSLEQNGVAGAELEEIEGKDIPIERFVSVAVPDLVPPPRITYDTPGSQTPMPPETQIPSEEKSPSTTTPDILDDDPNISSPSSTSAVEEEEEEEEEEDEPYSAEEEDEEEEFEEDVSDENSDDYISDGSDAFTRKTTRRNRSRQGSTPKNLPDVVVRVKQVAKAPKNRSAFVAEEVKTRPKVIAAKAPRSRAGMNPPEVMSKRAGLRNV